MAAKLRQVPAPVTARSIMEHLPPEDTPPSYAGVPHDMGIDLYRLLPESDNSDVDIERICPFQNGEWFMEPLYLGATPMLYDTKTGRLFSRGLTQIPSLLYFDEVRDKLEKIPKTDELRWLHLARLNNLDTNAAKQAVLLVDCMVHGLNYHERRDLLEKVGPPMLGIREKPMIEQVYLVPRFSEELSEELWGALHLMNQDWNTPLYGGILLKKSTSLYPMNNTAASKETHIWHEHRFSSLT